MSDPNKSDCPIQIDGNERGTVNITSSYFDHIFIDDLKYLKDLKRLETLEERDRRINANAL